MVVSSPNNDFLTFQRQTLDKSPQDVRAYWTPERKKAAIPVPMEMMPDGLNLPEEEGSGPATEPEQADLSKMPFTACGKLFYTMDGRDFVASGNIFMQRNMLLTAAHCVQNKQSGNLAENFIFEQCYTGEQSSEDFTFKTVALKENWYLKKNVTFDYAIAILDKNSDFGVPLRYSIDPNILGRTVTSMGYPTTYFDGAQMMFAKGSVTPRKDHWIMPGSKMGPGSSGGAWVLEDGITAIGVGAYVVRSGKKILFAGSPRFNEDFDQLYQYALTLM